MKKLIFVCVVFALLLTMITCLSLFCGAVEVSDAAAFVDAVEQGGTVTLANDITLTTGISIGKDVTIDGNGYTIEFSATQSLDKASYVTVSGSKVVVAAYALEVTGGKVTLSNITLKAPISLAKGGAMLLLNGAADLTLENVITSGSHFPLVYNAAATVTVKGTDTHLGKDSGNAYVVSATANAAGATLCLMNGVISHTLSDELRTSGECIFLNCATFTLQMENGSIVAGGKAVYMPNGTLTVQMRGGEIASGEGQALALDAGRLSLQMSDGCMTSSTTSVLALPTNADHNIAISGGTLRAQTEGSYVLESTGTTVISGNAVLEGSLLIAGGQTTISDNAQIIAPTYSYALSASRSRLVLVYQSSASSLIMTGGKLDIGDADGFAMLLGHTDAAATISGGRLVAGTAGSIAKLNAGTLRMQNALIVDGCAGTSTVFDSPEVSVSECIVIAKLPKAVGGNAEAVLTASAPCVKYGGVSYYVWMNFAADAKAPTLQEGAGVRAELGSQGIRFTAGIATSVASALEAEGKVTYGILIAPADHVAAAGDFTVAALEAYATKVGKNSDAIYVNVVADKSLCRNEDTLSFNAVLIDVQEANYGRKIAAVAYACVNDTYYYSAFDSNENARSLSEIAETALADTKTAAQLQEDDALKALYVYPVADTEQYSKYTKEQRDALAGYIVP
ncbi:MAG: hypothetical protein IJY16_04230 [Clostridia bacterium]|nr:hypothetical protein [Clostridia bacterium]